MNDSASCPLNKLLQSTSCTFFINDFIQATVKPVFPCVLHFANSVDLDAIMKITDCEYSIIIITISISLASKIVKVRVPK